MTPRFAAWRPSPERHNIWELIVHAAYWKYVAWRRLTGGKEARSFPLAGSNFIARPVAETKSALQADLGLLDEMHRTCARRRPRVPRRNSIAGGSSSAA